MKTITLKTMQKIILTILIYIISISSYAQQTEEEKDKERNAFLKEHLEYLNNYSDLGNYDENGEKTGEWTRSHKIRKTKFIENYYNGKKEGEWKFFSKEGVLCEIENYKNDTLSGLYQSFIQDVYLFRLKTNTLSPDDLGSIYEFLFDEEIPIISGIYKKGKKTGKWEYRNVFSGAIVETGNYNKDKKTGEWVTKYIDGSIKSKGNYLKGKKTGEWEVISMDRKKEIGKFENDKRTGEWKTYHENGKLIKTKNYTDKE